MFTKLFKISTCLLILSSQYGFSSNNYDTVNITLQDNSCDGFCTGNILDEVSLYDKDGNAGNVKFLSNNNKKRRKITITLEADNISNCNIKIETLNSNIQNELVNTPKIAKYKFLDMDPKTERNNKYDNKNINQADLNTKSKIENTQPLVKQDNNNNAIIIDTSIKSTKDNNTNINTLDTTYISNQDNKTDRDRDFLSEFVIQQMINQSNESIKDPKNSFEKYWENKDNKKLNNIGNNGKGKQMQSRNNKATLFNNLTYNCIKNNKINNNLKFNINNILKAKNLKKLYKQNTSRNYINKNNIKINNTNTKPAVKFNFTKKPKLLDINKVLNLKKNNLNQKNIKNNKWQYDPAFDKETNEILQRLDIAYENQKRLNTCN